jgi:signal transduction histidine kinase
MAHKHPSSMDNLPRALTRVPRRNLDRWRFLAEAGVALGSALGVEEAVATALHAAVPRLADLSVIWLLRGDSAGSMRVVHARAELRPLLTSADAADPKPLPDDHPAARVLRTGNAEFMVVHVDRLQAIARDAEHLARLRALGLTTLMVVPLAVRGRMIGSLGLGTALVSARRYRRRDLALAREFALRVATAVDSALRYDAVRCELAQLRARLAATSHDLKDPLMAIDLALQFALEDGFPSGSGGSPPPYEALIRSQLGAAHRAAQRMRRLIHDTLDLSAAEAGCLRLAPSDVAPATLLANVVEEYRLQARARSVALELEPCRSLPSLYTDGERLRRALGNILGNAIKFTPAGGRVTVRAVATNRAVTFIVTDTGPGIAAADQARIFEPYWRATRAASVGSGLGLSIARTIIEAAGGTICCSSEHGAVTTFRITLPTASAPAIARTANSHNSSMRQPCIASC